jgi:hypothetical protein
MVAAQDASQGSGKLNGSYSTIVDQCSAMPHVRNGS